MDVLEKYYDRPTFVLLALFTTVPGKSVWPRRFFLVFSSLILSFCWIFQVQKFVVDGLQMELIIELLPTVMAASGSLVYMVYIMGNNEYAVLLLIMLNDINEERTAEEDAIKERHANGARIFTKTYSKLLLIASCEMMLSGLTPQFLDLLIPLNETRKRQLIYNGESFFDKEKYFYLIYFVESCSIFVVAILVGVSENVVIIILQHICGMLAVTGHRLENIAHVEKYKSLNSSCFENLVAQRLKSCIESHQKSIWMAEFVDNLNDIPLTLMLISTFCAMIVSLVQVTDPQLVTAKMIFFTTTQFVQFFLMSYMGQNLINISESLQENVYYSRWYIFPPKIQKLMQLIILRSSKPCEIVPRGVYTFSVQNFTSVIQTVMSFFMVLRRAK